MLVYRGSLRRSPEQTEIASSGSRGDDSQMLWGTIDRLDLSQSILFSNDPDILAREVRDNICPFLIFIVGHGIS